MFWSLAGGHNLQGGLEQLVTLTREGGAVTAQCPSLQAHEDSEKLREIVLPMEQEIAELKGKLLRAEELIQEIQVRRGDIGALREGGVSETLASSLFPAMFPRDDQGNLPPCTAPPSCFRCQGTRRLHWKPWRSQVETQAQLRRPLPTTVTTVPPSLPSPSVEQPVLPPFEAPRA